MDQILKAGEPASDIDQESNILIYLFCYFVKAHPGSFKKETLEQEKLEAFDQLGSSVKTLEHTVKAATMDCSKKADWKDF